MFNLLISLAELEAKTESWAKHKNHVFLTEIGAPPISWIYFSYHFMVVPYPTNTSMVYHHPPAQLTFKSVFARRIRPWTPKDGANRLNRLDLPTKTLSESPSTNPDLHRGPLTKWHSTSLRCWKTRSMSCRMNLFQASTSSEGQDKNTKTRKV